MRVSERIAGFIKSRVFFLICLLVLMVAVFWYFSPKHSYVSTGNIVNILNSMVLFILLAVAVSFPILLGEFDLSPGFVGTAAGTTFATLLFHTGVPWYAAIIICLALGVAFGLLNALLVNKFSIQSFIATLAVGFFIASGVSMIVPDGKALEIKHPVINWIADYKFFDIFPVTVIVSLIIIVVYGIVLSKTGFGRSIYLSGGNKQASRLAGLNPKKLSYIVFANSGMLGALAGLVRAMRLKNGTLEGTSAYAFPAVTAVIFGGISFGGGSGSMLGCFLGLLVLNGFQNGLTIMRISPYWQEIAAGCLLLIALTIDYLSKRRITILEIRKMSKLTEKDIMGAD